MTIINEKTRIPLGWALAIFMSGVGVIATGATAHYRLGALETQARAHEVKLEAIRDRQHEDDKRMQRIEDKLDTMAQSLQRIERKMFKNE